MEYRGRAMQMQTKKRYSGRHLPVHKRTLQSTVLSAVAVVLICICFLILGVYFPVKDQQHRYASELYGWYVPKQPGWYATTRHPWQTQSRIIFEDGLILWEDIEK